MTENCTVRTPKFVPLTSLIPDVYPNHNIGERVFCLNPGTFDLNLGRGNIEREQFINVAYQEILFSFLCKEI